MAKWGTEHVHATDPLKYLLDWGEIGYYNKVSFPGTTQVLQNPGIVKIYSYMQ